MTRPVLALTFLLMLAVMGCRDAGEPFLNPLPAGPEVAQPFAPAARVSGAVGSPSALPAPLVSLGNQQSVAGPGAPRLAGGGTISLNFADTDIREVVAQVLGGILGATYTIDPAVAGTATLRTAQPVTQAQLLPILQTLLAQNGASLVQVGGVYRIVAGTATGAPVVATAPGGAPAGLRGGAGPGLEPGATVVALRNASAEDLARVLQPFVSGGARI